MNLRELLFLHAASGGGGSLVEDTATGNPVAFNTNVAKPLNSVVVPLTYTQSGTGDPSPSNVRPISGLSSLFCVHTKKNMAKIRGYSATNINYPGSGNMTNNYGTSINTNQPGDSVVITQSTSTTDYSKASYRNGYFTVLLEPYCVVDNARYDISFRVTNITGNPLDATLSNWHILRAAGGSEYEATEVKDDVIIFKNVLYKEMSPTARYSWEIRNCAMSCTVSEFMITPANTNDGVYEAYDGAKLDVVFPALGKNLLEVTANSKTEAGVTYTVNPNGTITFSGTATGYSNLVVGTADISSAEKVRISGLKGNATNIVWDSFNLYDANNILVESVSGGGSVDNKTVDLTQYPTAVKMRVVIRRSGNLATSGTAYPMVEIGETASAFEPYCNSVYGGSLDLVSGVLTLTHAYRKFTGASDESWAVNESHTGFACAQWTEVKDKGVTACNMSPSNNSKGDFPSFGYVYNQNSSYNIRTCLVDEAMTAAQFKAWLAEHPLELICPLVNPVTVQLTPAQASAFVGANTVWTDTTGNLTIKYLNKA